MKWEVLETFEKFRKFSITKQIKKDPLVLSGFVCNVNKRGPLHELRCVFANRSWPVQFSSFCRNCPLRIQYNLLSDEKKLATVMVVLIFQWNAPTKETTELQCLVSQMF